MKDYSTKRAKEVIEEYISCESPSTPAEEEALDEAVDCLVTDMKAKAENGQPVIEKVGSLLLHLPAKGEK